MKTSSPLAPTAPQKLFTRDFTLFFTARSISVLGDHMLMPITITVAMLNAGFGITGVGYALAAHMAPNVLFLVVGGVLVDRFTPLRVMITADWARLGLHGGLAFAFATGTPDLWLILLLLAGSGMGAGAFQPGLASVIPRVATDIQKANAAIRVTESSMMIAGPAVAGVLFIFADVWVVLAIDAATFAISAVLLQALRIKIPRPEGKRSVRRELSEGWAEFRSHTWLWQTIAIFMLFALTVAGPFITVGLSTIEVDHGGPTLGMLMAILGGGSVIGGLVAVKLRPTRPLRAGLVAMSVRAAGPLAIALSLPVPWIAVGFALTGLGQAFWLVMFHTSVQTHVPIEKLGRVNSYEVAGSMAAAPVGQALAGPIALLIGTTALLSFSTAMVLVTVALLFAMPAIRNLTRR